MMSRQPARLLRGAPYLPVASIGDAGQYFGDVLGFQAEYIGGEEFAIYARDGCAIMLRRVADPSRLAPNNAHGGTWDAFFWADDAETLCAELVGRGAVLAYGLTEQPYGMKEFAVRGPHGYVIGFGQVWPPATRADPIAEHREV